MNKLGIVGVGLLLVLITANIDAYATSTVEAVGSPYNMGDTGEFKICVDSDTTINKVVLYKPDHTQAWESPSEWTLDISANTCETIEPGSNTQFPGNAFSGFDMAGTWVFAANVQGGNTFLYEFVVSFLVVPEAAIGAVAIIGSSIAVLGAYAVLRKR